MEELHGASVSVRVNDRRSTRGKKEGRAGRRGEEGGIQREQIKLDCGDSWSLGLYSPRERETRYCAARRRTTSPHDARTDAHTNAEPECDATCASATSLSISRLTSSQPPFRDAQGLLIHKPS